MANIAQRTHSLKIDRLKGIRDLTEISFEDKPLTGIFGPNCVGKSTILHALAAAYCAPTGCPTAAHYRQWFPSLADDAWNGTHFVIDHTYTTTEAVTIRRPVEYRKGTIHTWWQPTINRRPQRHVAYVGIKSCVPDLEAYPWHDLRGAVLTPCDTAMDNRVREAASCIFNHNYTAIADVTLPHDHRRKYRSLTRGDLGGQSYPSVTMGSGEQRLLRLLYAVEQTRDKGLILIDELDLMLHGAALKNLIGHLYAQCTRKHQQLVFTSHREELLSLSDKINIRHLCPQGGKHFCYENTDPDSLHRMTGNRVRPLELFVEDDVAEAIADRVSDTLRIGRHVQTIRFGPATNCFTVLAGLLIKGETCDQSLFVLDGDVYRTDEAKAPLINKACTGNGEHETELRTKMPSLIAQFVLPDGENLESRLHQMICSLTVADMEPSDAEVAQRAAAIVRPVDQHGYIYHLIQDLGGERSAQLSSIVRLASRHPDWAALTAPVRDWLTAKKTELHL